MNHSTYATGRKRHRRAAVEDCIEVVQRTGIADVTEVAEALGISVASARRKLDGAVHRGFLLRDEYDETGHALGHEHYRYTERFGPVAAVLPKFGGSH
jgi:DNA-binding IclR family transcriptional regulator